jgi:drug/metabolite transporter (DMT)-like permease
MPTSLLSDKRKLAIIALIISNTIWGAASPIFKWSLQNVHPFTLAYLRFALAVFVLFPFVYKDLRLERKDLGKVMLLSIFGITINISFFFFALTKTESINAPIIGSSAPIFVMLISFFLLRERIQIKQVLGTVVGLVGIITIVLTPLFKNGLDSSLSGNLFLIIATLGGVIHVILTKEIANKYKPVCIVFYSFIIGTLSFTPGFVWEIKEYGFLTDINLSGIIGIAFGAVFASAIAYSLQEWALEYLRASEVGLFTYMDPVVAVLIAVPLLGEIPTPEFLVGSFLVFMGIFIAEGRLHYHPLHKLK